MKSQCITTTVFFVLLLSLSGAVIGQVAYILRDSSVGNAEGFYLPSAQYPGGAALNLNPYVPTPNLPAFYSGASPAGRGVGGYAINEVGMTQVFVSDGRRVWQEEHDVYGVNGWSIPPTAGPQGMLLGHTTFFSPTSSQRPMIMGLSVDHMTQTLWMCDRHGFRAFSSVYPYPAKGAYVPLAVSNQPSLNPFPSLPIERLTGIAFDPADDTLWLCDWNGHVYHVTQSGTPLAILPPVSITKFTGIAVNSSNRVPSVLPPSCSGQTGGMRIIVTDGNVICDPLTGGFVQLSGGGASYGLAYSSDAQFSFGASGSNNASLNISRSFVSGAGVVDLNLVGAGQNLTCYLLWGLCPSFPGQPAFSGGFIRVNDGYLALMSDGLGNAALTLPMNSLPAGLQLTFQWAYRVAQTTSVWALTDAMTITLGQS